MRLYRQSALLSAKYALKAAALPLAMLLLCLLFILFSGAGTAQAPPLQVGLLCLDNHPLMPKLITAVSGSAQELAELTLLSPTDPTESYDLVVTLPVGFTKSILTGENLSPTVRLGHTGLSSVYIREFCTAAERYLASAQAGIYATLESLPPMAEAQYNEAVTTINLRYITLFLNRLAMLSKEYSTLDSFYLLRSGMALLLCLLCGCLGYAVTPLLATARAMRGLPHSSLLLFWGGATGIFLTALLLLPPCLFAAFGSRTSLQALALPVLAALMMALALFFFALAGRNGGTAALLLCGFTLATALFSGILLPLEILPPFFSKIAPLFPVYQVRALVSLLSGGYDGGVPLGALAHIALWLGLALLCWSREVEKP